MFILHTLYGELYRQYALWRSYLFSSLGSIISLSIGFIILILTFKTLAQEQGATYGPEEQLASLIGVLIWNFCAKLIGGIPYMILQEAELGTLGNLLINPKSAFTTLLLRTVAVSSRQFFDSMLMGIFLCLALRLTPSFSSDLLIVTILTMFGAWGVGFALAGLALIYKAIGNIASLIANLALFISGALIPLNSLEQYFAIIRIFFPTSLGIDMLRTSAIRNSPITSQDGQLLLLQTTIMVVLGYALFQFGLTRAKINASLSTY